MGKKKGAVVEQLTKEPPKEEWKIVCRFPVYIFDPDRNIWTESMAISELKQNSVTKEVRAFPI